MNQLKVDVLTAVNRNLADNSRILGKLKAALITLKEEKLERMTRGQRPDQDPDPPGNVPQQSGTTITILTDTKVNCCQKPPMT